MCDMLLDARSGDVGLWSPILADACRHDDLRRVLIMRVFPRVVRSSVADAFARSGAALAASWEEVGTDCCCCLSGENGSLTFSCTDTLSLPPSRELKFAITFPAVMQESCLLAFLPRQTARK